jgi:hypothetical protein
MSFERCDTDPNSMPSCPAAAPAGPSIPSPTGRPPRPASLVEYHELTIGPGVRSILSSLTREELVVRSPCRAVSSPVADLMFSSDLLESLKSQYRLPELVRMSGRPMLLVAGKDGNRSAIDRETCDK